MELRTNKTKGILKRMAGKKRIDINWDKLEGMLIFDASLYVCADTLGCSHDTLERKVKQKFGQSFGEYKARMVDRTALKLKHKMITKALAGDNTCLIFSLKNLSNWCDKVEHGFDKDKQQILLKYSLNAIPTDDGTNGSGAA